MHTAPSTTVPENAYLVNILYIITLGEHECNFTDFVAYLESFFQIQYNGIHIGMAFINYARQQLIFAERAGDKGGIQLYFHAHAAYLCLCSYMSNSSMSVKYRTAIQFHDKTNRHRKSSICFVLILEKMRHNMN